MNKLDNRYTIEFEYLGFQSPRYAARFCGEYLGQNRVKAYAVEICIEHNKRRQMSIETKEVATIYSPFKSSRMKIQSLDSGVIYMTIKDEGSVSAMKFGRRELVELYGVIGGLLEGE